MLVRNLADPALHLARNRDFVLGSWGNSRGECAIVSKRDVRAGHFAGIDARLHERSWDALDRIRGSGVYRIGGWNFCGGGAGVCTGHPIETALGAYYGACCRKLGHSQRIVVAGMGCAA